LDGSDEGIGDPGGDIAEGAIVKMCKISQEGGEVRSKVDDMDRLSMSVHCCVIEEGTVEKLFENVLL
jgi:hypothetical protein